MNTYVLPFEEIDKAAISIAGGKGANLGELCKIEGISVPDGFCVTTAAFKRVIGTPAMSELVDRLSLLKMDDRHLIREISGAIREEIRAIAIPAEIIEEIGEYISRLGEQAAYAVRSSATAEDLPTASFAGQQDTFLSIVGKDAIMQHVSRCWASLFTERAVMYRMQNGFDHRKVYLSVVVQKMVFPRAAGILFTADPVTGNRKVSSIDAGFGLGEALVSGLVNADTYKVRDGRIIGKQVQAEQVLTDEQILRLEEIGRIIEAHFGRPQDIEWCLADDSFYIVQSRPITTLFPIPEVNDQANHVYVSVGHQQMMTDPLKPLGLSLRQLTAARPMNTAGGRQFVDVTVNLSSAAGRESLLKVMGGHDPLMKDALVTIIERGFIKLAPDEGQRPAVGAAAQGEIDPGLVGELIRNSEQAIEALKQRMQTALGPAVFELILEDIPHFKKTIFDPRTMKVIMAGIDAYTWINEKMQEWLGEKNVADVLSQSAPNNVTSEMGLDLLNVADAIRPYPEVIGYLEQVKEEDFFDELSKLKGGREARDAIQGYLDRYGMRCAGEIDITKPRWSERPATLVPLLLANVRNF
ncbi:MAG TPA: phosphoenolpyruvate synthase, partial [Puia sp.]|nr:phosphoenolpyruvate synthase [Puia sp.]